jgi:transmembrane sensor
MTIRIGWRAIARYFAGESTPEEAAAIQTWANAERANAELLEASKRAWDAAEPPPAQWNADAAWQNVAPQIRASRPARVWLWPAAAAAILLLIGGPLVWRQLERNDEQTISTGAGEQRTVRLADGSVARLAERTRLYVSRENPRAVRLEGTAFFGITERNEPFTVRTAAGEARVLGTRFELHAERNSLRLAVLEGRVALKTETGSEQVVEAGQVTLTDARDVAAPRRTDVQQMLGWMGRVLIFQDTPLQQAAREIERLYGVDVRVTTALLNDRTVTATFENENVSTVVATLCRVVDARCDLQNRVVRISQ